jgi:peptide/nickel transport system substrate-binding protein
VRADTYTFTVRKDYAWGEAGSTTQGAGYPGTVTYKVITNDTTAANLLLTGGLDVASITGPDLPRVQADRSLAQTVGVPYGTNFLLVNELGGRVGADPQVRKAIFQAIDSASWGKAAAANQAVVATSFITPVVPCFDANTKSLVPAFDLSAAKSTLQADGWTAGSDGKLSKAGQQLTLDLAASAQGNDSSAEYMLNALQQLGANVKLNNVDFVTYTGILFGTTTPWDVAVLPFGPPIPTPYAVNGFVSGATPAQKGTNAAYINNTTYVSEAAAGLASTGSERCMHWASAQEALLKSFDIKPLAYADIHYFAKHVQFRVIGGGAVIDVSTFKKTA